MESECPVREDYFGERRHEPGRDQEVTGLHKNPWTPGGRRRSAYCRFCQILIFSNHLTGHMTRDVRWGKWYHEDYIITEWP